MSRHRPGIVPNPLPRRARPTVVDRIFRVLTPRRMAIFRIISEVLAFVFICYSVWQTQSNQHATQHSLTEAQRAQRATHHALILIQQERSIRSHQVDDRIHQIACTLVAPYRDNIPYVRDFRHKYHCPPYNHNIAKQLRPTHAPTPAPSHGTGGEASEGSTASHPSVSVPVRPTSSPSSRSIAPSRTPTATRSAPRTVTPSSSHGILPIPSCTINIAGIRIC